MQKFISCDWGTTSLRVRLIDPADLSVVAQSISKHGIGMVHNLWQQNGGDQNERLQFYKRFLADKILAIKNETGISLSGFPVIVSGMASSSIGMMELPWVDLPIPLDGSDLIKKMISPSADFEHELILVSGIKTTEDIARGEETQLIGCNPSQSEESIYIFPGTHSKHIFVKNGRAVNLKTYMTGEFLQLLSEKSILSYSVEEQNATDAKSFEAGVNASEDENLLSSAFKVRINDLFGKVAKAQNFSFLKGLLIGAELRSLRGKKGIRVVANNTIGNDYALTSRFMDLEVSIENSESATITGHSKILLRYLK